MTNQIVSPRPFTRYWDSSIPKMAEVFLVRDRGEGQLIGPRGTVVMADGIGVQLPTGTYHCALARRTDAYFATPEGATGATERTAIRVMGRHLTPLAPPTVPPRTLRFTSSPSRLALTLPGCYVVTGMVEAGKTALARHLATEFRAPYFLIGEPEEGAYDESLDTFVSLVNQVAQEPAGSVVVIDSALALAYLGGPLGASGSPRDLFPAVTALDKLMTQRGITLFLVVNLLMPSSQFNTDQLRQSVTGVIQALQHRGSPGMGEQTTIAFTARGVATGAGTRRVSLGYDGSPAAVMAWDRAADAEDGEVSGPSWAVNRIVFGADVPTEWLPPADGDEDIGLPSDPDIIIPLPEEGAEDAVVLPADPQNQDPSQGV